MNNFFTTSFEKTPRNARRLKYLYNLRGLEVPHEIEQLSKCKIYDPVLYDETDKFIDFVQYVDDFDSRVTIIDEEGSDKALYYSIKYCRYKKFKKIAFFYNRKNIMMKSANVISGFFSNVLIYNNGNFDSYGKSIHNYSDVEVRLYTYVDLKDNDIFEDYKPDIVICDTKTPDGFKHINRMIEYIGQEVPKTIALVEIDNISDHQTSIYLLKVRYNLVFNVCNMLRPNSAGKLISDTIINSTTNPDMDIIKKYRGSIFDFLDAMGCYKGCLGSRTMMVDRTLTIS